MHSHLNQIFYIPKKFDNDFTVLKEYMMSNEYIQTCISDYELNKKSIAIVKDTDKFQPYQINSIFWCIYTIHHGINDYMMIQNKHKNKEMDEKQKILEYIQGNCKFIKELSKQYNHKITQVGLKEIQSELLLDAKLSNTVFAVLCIYYKINAVIQNGSIYMHFHTNQEHTYLFTQNKKSMMDVDLIPLSSDAFSHIQSTCILVPYEQDKPLKAISNYKICDLEEIAKKLQIQLSKMKKQDLYNTILLKLVEIQN
jgi:hypothetical protein